ncbi:MAG TPA: inositol monophosphatase family protein, partial [Anaerolineae bacterium]|nr:inositol monophosphatase family protein [Anaerolineae bacterium]
MRGAWLSGTRPRCRLGRLGAVCSLITTAAQDIPSRRLVEALCREAGRVSLRRWGGSLQVTQKGAVDLVTDVDLALEELIREAVTRRFPEHTILSEERGQDETAPQADYVWMVDPLDGTTNYVHGHPVFCISVGL